MKEIFFLPHTGLITGLFLLSCSSLSSTNIINRNIRQNNTLLNCEDFITSPMPIAISLNDTTIKGEWTMEVLRTNGQYEPIEIPNLSGNNIHINPQEYEKYFKWFHSRKNYIANLNRDYYLLKLSFETNTNVVDSIFIKWCLAPTHPYISDVIFNYKYDWSTDSIFPNGWFSFNIASEDATSYLMNVSDSFLYDAPDWYPWCKRFYPGQKMEYDAEWGEFIHMQAENRFGVAFCDPICTTSYITDPEILKRIDELRPACVKSLKFNNSTSWYTISNNMLVLNNPAESVNIYNLQGIKVFEGKNIENINLSNLTRETYIIVAITQTEHLISKFYKP